MTIVSIVDAPGAFIEGMAVPKELQGQGLGRKEYEEWEAKLPALVEFITLRSVPTSLGFWHRMGFTALLGSEPGMLFKPRTLFTIKEN